ncbi:MAG: NAD(P)-dependent oxidoreductase [Saprospiraceae bacterium]|nr:NAD(P)-dependent oxidoreductase [Saprospiraceae bacterium]MBX7175600.1 NAD(P)-dependent oxidoreductase [Saprospiraceae bacterium]HMW38524.1 NAD(P)-dependent oxidoreductase [Saprospiraceae bacterium]HMX88590.1 NAD(P)-dependent oxidoreductase [Saprospiraceae bacterium]HMZ40628.1 NAD(P)-dependent oxidoreductase [Saprospiraceae bacterium]
MEKILITGAHGLLGKEVVSELLGKAELFLVVKGDTKVFSGNLLHYVDCDLDSISASTKLPLHIDKVLHLAQSGKFREFPESVTEIYNVNTYSTLLLLDYARKAGCKNFIYASSGAVYKDAADNTALRETDPLNCENANFYAASKLASELLVNSYSRFFNSVICRYFFIYGKGQKQDMLIPRLIDSVRHQREISVNGQNGLVFNPIHVHDAAMATILLSNLRGNHVVNVAGPQAVNLRQVIQYIEELLGLKALVNSDKNLTVSALLADITRLTDFGYTPRINLNEGIGRVIKE